MIIEYGDKVIYESQPRQTVFHNSNSQCRLYGGAAGGGKTEAILWEIFSLCNDPEFPGLKGAIFRKTIPDIEKYFVRRATESFPANQANGKPFYKYNQQKRIMTFMRTGSQVEFNYCEGEADLRNYQGAEWDFLAIDEFTQHSEYVFKFLFGRMRTKKPGWKVRFFGGSNPGGIGHGWVKRIWIDQERTPEENKFNWEFIPARLDDNPKMLEHNPTYEDQLMMLPDEAMRKALRWGDWNIFAGQYFPEIRYDIHGFEPFEIHKSWPRFIEIDYGFDHPAVCQWNAIDPDGDVWKYRELVLRHKTYTEFAEEIVQMTDLDEKIDYGVADPSIWAKRGAKGGLSGAEEMQSVLDKRNIVLMPADNDRLNGWGIMREWLKVYQRRNPHDGKPEDHSRLHVSTALRFWWKWVPQMQRDPKKPEDVLKATTQTEDGTISYSDDSGDATRYGLMSRPRPNKQKPKEDNVDRYGQKIKKRKKVELTIKNRATWKPFENKDQWLNQ